ncbi:MAG: hypothetical protein H5U19_04270 [Rhodobacteraceae bacterium]|nr:hypothetical protein [Paracoccaceae bacterium]
MTSNDPLQPAKAAPRRTFGRRVLRFVRHCTLVVVGLGAVVALIAGIGIYLMTGGRVLPISAVGLAPIEARLNAALGGKVTLRLNGAELWFDENWHPGLRLLGTEVLDPAGAPVAELPDLRATFDLDALRGGRVVPRSLRVDGAGVTLKRDVDGSIDLLFGGGVRMQPIRSVSEFLDSVDAVFDLPVLASVGQIRATGLTLVLDDARADRVWRVGDGALVLDQRGTEVALDLRLSLADAGGGVPADVGLSFVSPRRSSEARLSARVAHVRAKDIAVQNPSLAWLAVLDAPISGEFSAEVDKAGKLGPIHAELSLGAGAMRPEAPGRAVPFRSAALAMDFDPRSERLTLGRIEVQSQQMRMKGTGTIYPEQPGVMTGGGLPSAFLVQIELKDMQIDPAGVFTEPVRFGAGMLDMRLGLRPLSVDIGQAVLIDGDRRLIARGSAHAAPKGWRVSVDAALNEVSHDRLIALWPPAVVEKTRRWVQENVSAGMIYNVDTALRLEPGATPEVTLGYEFRDAHVRFLPTLPEATAASGYASLRGKTYVTTALAGHVTAPEGGDLDIAGSVFVVPDITKKPGMGEVDLRADGPITAALSLLDQPPFRFLEKAGRGVDLATGRAIVRAHISVPLVRGAGLDEVEYSGTGRLIDVTSEVLVPGRVLTARELALNVDRGGIEISGPGTLSGVPFTATWQQAFGPENAGKSHVGGTVELSQGFSDAFGIGLPAGMLSGAATGRIDIDLMRDQPPEFRLTSTMGGMAINLPQVGWHKASGAQGVLEVAGRLGTPADVDVLKITAPGLVAEGRVRLQPDGRLGAVDFSRVRLAGWLDAPVVLRPQGRGLAVDVSGGVITLDKLPEAMGNGGGAGTGAPANVPISLTLDRLEVSDTLVLTGFRGDFSTAGGFSGSFIAAVNGGPQVKGTLAPSGGRTAVRLRASDAGAVFRAANTLRNARGGDMDLVLMPGAKPGEFDGTLRVNNLRVVDAPILAAMLNAISVVGLLEQLTGDGLAFNTVEGKFRLTPTAIVVEEASAVGASLGVSLKGSYGLVSKRMAFQGVFSPIYMLNRIGSLLTRRGEGLFGFNYSVTGTADRPLVSVNPLSILAPSGLRNLLRGKPEEIAR